MAPPRGLAIMNIREGSVGSARETKAINTWILATFPSNSLEINTPVIAAYNPNNGADVLDHEPLLRVRADG